MPIYVNNAGTSWPKPSEVHRAIEDVLQAPPEVWGERFEELHAEVASSFGIREPGRLVITPSCTSALAAVISSLPWEAGDRIVTSALEHHALSRWTSLLARDRAVAHDIAPYAPGGPVDLTFVEERLRAGSVKLVACTMASNVTGELLPVRELSRLAHAHGALFLLDAAQTAGTFPLDPSAMDVDLFVFAGHKGPLGPQGVGGFYAAPHVSFASPTASCSLEPGGGADSFPSYCDVGSVNLAGLAGLAAGLRWLRERGPEEVLRHVRGLTRRLRQGLGSLPGVSVYGAGQTTATVSVTFDRCAVGGAAEYLARRGIIARGGFHCAPLAHQALGTTAEGTLRLSFGPFNTADDVDEVLAALRALPPSPRRAS